MKAFCTRKLQIIKACLTFARMEIRGVDDVAWNWTAASITTICVHASVFALSSPSVRQTLVHIIAFSYLVHSIAIIANTALPRLGNIFGMRMQWAGQASTGVAFECVLGTCCWLLPIQQLISSWGNWSPWQIGSFPLHVPSARHCLFPLPDVRIWPSSHVISHTEFIVLLHSSRIPCSTADNSGHLTSAKTLQL